MSKPLQRLLWSEDYCEFMDVILVESPFTEVPRNGRPVRDVYLGLTPDKFIMAKCPGDAHMVSLSTGSCEFELVSIFHMGPQEIKGVRLSVSSSRETMIRARFANGVVKFFRLNVASDALLVWKQWVWKLAMVKQDDHLHSSTASEDGPELDDDVNSLSFSRSFSNFERVSHSRINIAYGTTTDKLEPTSEDASVGTEPYAEALTGTNLHAATLPSITISPASGELLTTGNPDQGSHFSPRRRSVLEILDKPMSDAQVEMVDRFLISSPVSGGRRKSIAEAFMEPMPEEETESVHIDCPRVGLPDASRMRRKSVVEYINEMATVSATGASDVVLQEVENTEQGSVASSRDVWLNAEDLPVVFCSADFFKVLNLQRTKHGHTWLRTCVSHTALEQLADDDHYYMTEIMDKSCEFDFDREELVQCFSEPDLLTNEAIFLEQTRSSVARRLAEANQTKPDLDYSTLRRPAKKKLKKSARKLINAHKFLW